MDINYEEIANTLKSANKIWIIGDGGSAALADHLACDLLKNCSLPAISLCSNSAVITAIANDYSFAEVFSIQLDVLFKKGDLLVVFSTSGNSPNLIEAVELIDNLLIVTGGGKLMKCSGIVCKMDSEEQMSQENEMLIFCHEVVKWLRK